MGMGRVLVEGVCAVCGGRSVERIEENTAEWPVGRERSGRGSARTVCAVLYSAVAKACGRERRVSCREDRDRERTKH